jgi:hypothetical protein
VSDDADARLERIREQLDEVNDLEVTERPEVFAAVNEALAEELDGMEDV